MNNNLTKVALRYRALYLDIYREDINLQSEATAPVVAFIARLKENGFCVSEELLHALNAVSANQLAAITKTINEVMGVDLNWAPLVKGWNVPTGESIVDHLCQHLRQGTGYKRHHPTLRTPNTRRYIPFGALQRLSFLRQAF